MSLGVPNSERLLIADNYRTERLDGCWLGLFKSNTTFATGMDFGDLTEADFDGYDRIQLTAWQAAALVGDAARIYHPPQTFLHGGGAGSNDIYGFFCVDDDDELILMDRNSGAPVTVEAGKGYTAKPVWQDTQ